MKSRQDSKNTRLGISIFILLAFLTAAEYVIAIEFGSTFLLGGGGLGKAGLVLYYYMHIGKLLQEDLEADRESLVYKTADQSDGTVAVPAFGLICIRRFAGDPFWPYGTQPPRS